MSKNDKPDIGQLLNKVNDVEEDKKNGNRSNNSIDIDSLKALEIGKIIVQESLNLDNLQSLTFINPDQIDDIVKARLLNAYYNIPEIDNFISDYLQLKRSENGQLMKLYVKMVMFNNEQNEEKKGFFSRILKR